MRSFSMNGPPLAELIIAITVGSGLLAQPEPVGYFHSRWWRGLDQPMEMVDNHRGGREPLFQGQAASDFQGFQAVGTGPQQQFDEGLVAPLLVEEQLQDRAHRQGQVPLLERRP